MLLLLANAAKAMAAADVRFLTRSLHRMRSTCLQIVPVHALRMTPISWFVLPCAIQLRTSVSRGVRPKEASGFSTSSCIIFVFSFCFLLVCGAFIWLFIFCHQHEQTWGKTVRILVSRWYSVPYSAGVSFWPSVSPRHGELIPRLVQRALCALMAHVKQIL